MVNRGINKLLYERRLELHFSLFEAAIKLDIYKFQLKLIEKGYLGISKKLKEMFIIKYKLPKDFFDNDLGYPVVIDKEVKKDNKKLINIIASWPTRFISLLGLAGFITMFYFGVINLNKTASEVTSFFSNEVLTMRKEVTNNKKTIKDKGGSDFKNLVADDYYLYEEEYTIEDDIKPKVGIGFFALDENITHTFYQSSYDVFETLVFKSKVSVSFESRCSSGNERLIFKIYNDGEQSVYLSADLKGDTFKYNIITSPIFGEGDNEIVNKNSFAYGMIVSFFESEVDRYRLCLNELFNKSTLDVKDPDDQSKRISYDKYHSILLNDTKKYQSYSDNASALTISGIIVSNLFLAILIASVFIKTRIVKKLSTQEKVVAPILDNNVEHETRELRPNLEFRPFIPESVLRIVGVIILFYSSIGLYYFVNSVLSFDIIGSIDIYNRLSVFKSLSSIAIIFIFFTKMDIVISKKNVFFTNYIMFFAGLIYYFLLLVVNNSLSLSQSIYGQIGTKLLNVLPGNFIWGILAFNLLAQLLFTVPEYIKGNKKREISYHSLTILPILYLLASALYTIGEKSWGWSSPLWFKNLFFTKSVPIILFAILYCLAIFVYKRLVIKEFGEKKAEIIRNGSRYYFFKNIIAASIVILIGIVELVVHFTSKNGSAFGFGENYLIICAAPFIIFYHPHRGNRNELWDFVFMILNGVAMMIGIVLLASSLINYLILI